MPTLVDNNEIVRRFADEFLNEGQYETGKELVAEDIADHTPFGDTTGFEAVVETMETVRAAFPDFVNIPHEILAEDDTVAVRMTQRGTHEGTFMGIEPTGKSFEIEAMGFARLEDGKILERWGLPALFGLFERGWLHRAGLAASADRTGLQPSGRNRCRVSRAGCMRTNAGVVHSRGGSK